MMYEEVKKVAGVDLHEYWEKTKDTPSLVDFDDKVTSKMFGFNGKCDYYGRAGCIN